MSVFRTSALLLMGPAHLFLFLFFPFTLRGGIKLSEGKRLHGPNHPTVVEPCAGAFAYLHVVVCAESQDRWNNSLLLN